MNFNEKIHAPKTRTIKSCSRGVKGHVQGRNSERCYAGVPFELNLDIFRHVEKGERNLPVEGTAHTQAQRGGWL